jgi:hypothetical protein
MDINAGGQHAHCTRSSNYHSGGAEIAGNWPPAWVAYLAGHAEGAGFTDIHFIDAMTNDLSDEDLRAAQGAQARCGRLHRHHAVHLQGRGVLKIAKESAPDAVTVLGGIHATFMYSRCWPKRRGSTCIVRGEGEEIFRRPHPTIHAGRAGRRARRSRASPIAWMASRSSPPRPLRHVKDIDGIARLVDPRLGQVHLHPDGGGSRSPTWRAAARSPARSAASGSSGATTASAIRRRWSTRSRCW